MYRILIRNDSLHRLLRVFVILCIDYELLFLLRSLHTSLAALLASNIFNIIDYMHL